MDEMVCAACFDRWSVEGVATDSLFQIEPLRSSGKYDEALAYLDAMLKANRHRSPGRSIRSGCGSRKQ
jgi:hypothetical protein